MGLDSEVYEAIEVVKVAFATGELARGPRVDQIRFAYMASFRAPA
jgi:hypothetical protein